MATRTHKLATTDLQIRNAKPEDKKLIFGNGLSVVITKTGRKTFYLYYQKVYRTLGTYPEIRLAEARELAIQMRIQIQEGDLRAVRSTVQEETFRESCDKYLAVHDGTWSQSHLDDTVGQINELCEGKLNSIGLGIGKIATSQIKKSDVLPIFNKIIDRGANSAVRDTIDLFRRILQHYNAQQSDLKKRVILEFLDLKDIKLSLPRKPKVRHHPALPHDLLPAFYELVLKVSDSENQTKYALLLAALTALRASSLSRIKISDIDIDKKEIIVPAEYMKMNEDFWVPLSEAAIIVIKCALRDKAFFEKEMGRRKSVWLFTGRKKTIKDLPMHPETTKRLMDRLGYKGKQSTHGLRTNLSSWAYSQLSDLT